MAQYVERIADTKLKRYLKELPAVLFEGAKGVGKTTMARRHAQTVFRMDDEITASLITGTPSIINESAKPVVIDEWQAAPSIFNTIRHYVDEDMTPGQYILAGSAIPIKAKLHSGAGRIVRMRLRPFSLHERGMAQMAVSLSGLLRGDTEIATDRVVVTQQQYVREIMASGFPGIRCIPETSRQDMLDSYIDSIVDREFADLGVAVRRPDALRAWMKAYAAAEGSTTSYESIINAASPGQDKKPSKQTTMTYRDTLAALWILDPVAPWLMEGSIYRSLGKAYKHHLVDPALAARLLDINERKLLSAEGDVNILGNQTKTLIGRLFEGLVAQSLKVYADANGVDVRHLRTARGDHEVDFIIEQGDVLVAIETKFAPHVGDDDVRHLNWLERTVTGRKIVKVLVYTGEYLATRPTDGVLLVPAACLGA
jgi:predicted AAA+ superfamily ATPase